ncbi:hypothetical protein GCM10010441_16710 [Kitasatospora paracochleata]|uniref:Uncharacterized protein n=1 Tax=Kitasatospora paracochleata TaxID=58354 RepID=A0ABT1IZ91_9ACTN|nr:hypothetical protein [Kitasatospora paracochleata]MCP2310467.1 hypothetical protein [Kitasatospora paracochleata]
MTIQELGPTAAEVQSLRAELDQLLRARQFATQRERRLAEAIRGGSLTVEGGRGPSRPPGPSGEYRHSVPQSNPDLLSQLAQAKTLREGLGARCLELSDRLLAMEDRLQAERLSAGQPGPEADHHRLASATGTGTGTGTGQHPPATESTPAGTASPQQRRRPIGARFGTSYEETTAPTVPAVTAAPVRGARFSWIKETPSGRDSPTPKHPVSAGHGNTGTQASGPSAAQAPPPPPPPHTRTFGELRTLVQRVSELHRRGAAQESAAIVAQAAVTLSPVEVAQLIELLRTDGPSGASGYLARSAAYGPAEQAVGTLAELRQSGLIDEAAELFHAMWDVPAAALPTLLSALERAGESADAQTLLWEWASAPPTELADVATRLREAGRQEDVRSLLRQAAGRQTGELAATALVLDRSLGAELVGAVVRLRSAVDVGAFASAIRGEAVLYGALLAAVDGIDESRARSAFAALRALGLPTEAPARPRSRGRR